MNSDIMRERIESLMKVMSLRIMSDSDRPTQLTIPVKSFAQTCLTSTLAAQRSGKSHHEETEIESRVETG